MPRRRPEADGQNSIVQFARLIGFLVYHTTDSRRSAPGFPDLWICGFGVLIIMELKFGRNKTSPAQDAWIAQLRLAGQDVRVYQVEDWGNLKLAEELKQIKRNWLSTPHQHASPTTSKLRSTTREGPS